MRFSVLVPVYNVENYIEQCLDSILGQTFQDFELVLVDDGSTDRSGIICDEYQTLYPKQIKVIHKENQGLISARRIGIKEATGEFCIFVDSVRTVEVLFELNVNVEFSLNDSLIWLILLWLAEY